MTKNKAKTPLQNPKTKVIRLPISLLQLAESHAQNANMTMPVFIAHCIDQTIHPKPITRDMSVREQPQIISMY